MAKSAYRRCVLDAALGPEPVDAATDAELGARAHIAVEHFTIIADLLDDANHPILGQPELLAEITLDAQQPPDLRLVRLRRLVDVSGGYAEFLGVDHDKVRPLDDVEPLVVAVAHQRAERFFGDDLRQDDMVVG